MKKALVGFAVFVLTILVAVGYYRTRFTANNSPPAAAPADTGVTATTADTDVTATTASSTQITWVPVHDQREQAFSIDVPQGWKTYGGMFRFSNTDARMVVDMTSPDGLTNIRVGDATIPPYTVPAPLTPKAPHQSAYVPASVFAEKYGQARFASLCAGLTLTKSSALIPKYHPASGLLLRTTGGEADFTCTKDGAPMEVYVYAETQSITSGGAISGWQVVALGSFIAPADHAIGVDAMLTRASKTLTMNSAWLQMQNRMNDPAAAVSNADARATSADPQQQKAREQGMISALINNTFNDVINGVQQTVDPSTGRPHTTPIGAGAPPWTDGGNTIVQSVLAPGPFTPPQSLPH